MSDTRRTARIDSLYQEYLRRQNPTSFTTAVSRYYMIGTLERLVVSGPRDIRRGAAAALGLMGSYESNAALGCALVDDDRMVRMLAENGIRSLWRRVGSEPQRRLLERIIQLNAAKQSNEAITLATQLIEKAPMIAEAWNQRAIAFYNLSRYHEAIRDCRETLELNPYHFDAASGMGQCFLQVGDVGMALESLRRALRINPGLDGVRAGIEHLSRHRKSD